MQLKAPLPGCTKYTKSTCLQVLKQHNNCLSCNDSYIAINSSVNQEANEDTARWINFALQLLGASQMCMKHLEPLMCLYLFPPCGSNATISREQCIYVTTGVCKTEWQMAMSFSNNQLPKCESLPPSGLLFNCLAIKTDFLYCV